MLFLAACASVVVGPAGSKGTECEGSGYHRGFQHTGRGARLRRIANFSAARSVFVVQRSFRKLELSIAILPRRSVKMMASQNGSRVNHADPGPTLSPNA